MMFCLLLCEVIIKVDFHSRKRRWHCTKGANMFSRRRNEKSHNWSLFQLSQHSTLEGRTFLRKVRTSSSSSAVFFVEKKPADLLLMSIEAQRVFFCNISSPSSSSSCFIVALLFLNTIFPQTNPWSFFWRQEKFNRVFFSYNPSLSSHQIYLGTELFLVPIEARWVIFFYKIFNPHTHGTFIGVERSSIGFFMQPFFLFFFSFVFSCCFNSFPREFNFVEKTRGASLNTKRSSTCFFLQIFILFLPTFS